MLMKSGHYARQSLAVEVRVQRPRILISLTVAIQLILAFPADAAMSGICDAAAQQAARETGVPLSVLRSITRTETGRARNGKLEPWPWTVNMEGKGKWFETEDAARSYVFHHFKRGARSFDVGCFQINYKWHGKAFSSIDQMFSPRENARYAARFLRQLHDELGDWSRAAGAYHSRTPKYAERYRARFDRIRAKLNDAPEPELRVASADQRVAKRGNAFPLLQSSDVPRSHGSLVPLTRGNSRALIQFANGS